jgi:hypothetical protein
MAHCDRCDSSFHALPPLRTVRRADEIRDAAVARSAKNNLGAYTGDAFAVAAYESPHRPAIAAFDRQDGSLLWTSPLGDLPAVGARRWVSGLLLARVCSSEDAGRRCVFAANPAEFVAYAADGTRLWRRALAGAALPAGEHLGAPRCVRFDDAGNLVSATTHGWILKLDPRDGTIIDAYLMQTLAEAGGRLRPGRLVTFKASVIIGDTLYLLTRFAPDHLALLGPRYDPVYLVRVALRRRAGGATTRPLTEPQELGEPLPDRVRVGVSLFGGSPSAMRTSDGRVLLFTNAAAVVHGHVRPTIVCVEDVDGTLRLLWRCVLDAGPDDAIYGAPVLDPRRGTLVAKTRRSVYVLRKVDSLTGAVPSPVPIPASDLVPNRTRGPARAVRMGGAGAIARDDDVGDLVLYSNIRVAAYGRRSYGFLGAIAFPERDHAPPRPLWCRPLALTRTGDAAPGPGTFGQPALFRYETDSGWATGLITNTVRTGTHIFR